MKLLDDCPACLYKAKKITASGFTFVGLIPPPASGDKLGVCVGCKKCRRSYCKDNLYYHPLLPRDLKLRDEHVGEEGSGLWLRFGQSDGKGPVQIEYESCSLPEDTCKKLASMKLALNYLRQDRVGHTTPKVCKTHADDFARLTAAAVARAHGNSNGQKDGDAERPRIGAPFAFTDADAFKTLGTLDRPSINKLATGLGHSRAAVRSWIERKGFTSLDGLLESDWYKQGGGK